MPATVFLPQEGKEEDRKGWKKKNNPAYRILSSKWTTFSVLVSFPIKRSCKGSQKYSYPSGFPVLQAGSHHIPCHQQGLEISWKKIHIFSGQPRRQSDNSFRSVEKREHILGCEKIPFLKGAFQEKFNQIDSVRDPHKSFVAKFIFMLSWNGEECGEVFSE